MKLDDEALPIHEDAEIKVRPRIFFEGNLFFDLQPGTPELARAATTAPRSRPRRPRRRCRSTRCSARSRPNTREDLQKLLVGYGDALNGEPEPGEDADQDPEVQGETARPGAERLARVLRRRAARRRDREPGAARDGAARPLEAGAAPAGVFAALSSNEAQLKDLITNFNITMGALASERTNLRATIARAAARCSRRPSPRSTT